MATGGRDGGEKGGAKQHPWGAVLPAAWIHPLCRAGPGCPAALQSCANAISHGSPAAQLPGGRGLAARRPTSAHPWHPCRHWDSPPCLGAWLLLPTSPDRRTGPAPLAPPAHRPLVGKVRRDGTPAAVLPRPSRALHPPIAATFISRPRSSHLPAPNAPLVPSPSSTFPCPPPAPPAASGTGSTGGAWPLLGLPRSFWVLRLLCHHGPPSPFPSPCQEWMAMPETEQQHSSSCCHRVAWGRGRQHMAAGTKTTGLGGPLRPPLALTPPSFPGASSPS